MTVYDIAIVGAGPSGAAAALTAHRLGLSVVVVDKATFPRDKTCGDGLTTNALRLLEGLGLDLGRLDGDGGYVHVDDVVLVDTVGRSVELPLPRGAGEYSGVVSRVCLDRELESMVRTQGVEVRNGVEVTGVERTTDGARLALADGGRLEARAVIAADGHWSPVRRMVQHQATPDLGEWHAVRQYFADAGDDRLWVFFEPDLLPGYFWIFPAAGGGANVGYGVLRSQGRSGRELKALWPDLLARPHIARVLGPRATPTESVHAWPIPTRYEPDALSDGPVLFVGDAARVVDPMTGEGIAQALETGILAAQAVAAGGDIGATYRRSVHRNLGRDLRFAARLQRVLAHPRGAQAAIRTVALSDWTRRNFARWMFEDYPRALLLTPDRWTRGMFHRPGAYRAP